MSDSTFKLQLLVRAELALAKFHARRTLFRTAVIAAAMVFLLMGLGMLNFAAYLSLLDKVSPGVAALLVAAGGNFFELPQARLGFGLSAFRI